MSQSDSSMLSILVRIKKVTVEDCYISVPITSDMISAKEDGSSGLDAEVLWKKAIEYSSDTEVEWKVEEITLEPHDIQKPIPEDRKSYLPGY